MKTNNSKKKVIIIGAGVSGMACASYLLDNNYDVEIYEKHNITGGECTAWTRKGVEIDGCAHWIIGVDKYSDFYPVWTHVGAFDENTKIEFSDYFTKFKFDDGDIVTIYANITKLEEELLRVAPEDKRRIKGFIRAIKAYQHVAVPVKKPIRHMNLFELTKFGLGFLPMAPYYLRYKHMSSKEYASRFKNYKLRYVFEHVCASTYNVHSFFYIMHALTLHDAGVIEGGSLQFAKNMENNVLSKGGKIFTNSEISKILVGDDHKVIGIRLKNGEEKLSDYVVASADVHHVLYDLLENKYTEDYFKKRFADYDTYPLNTAVLVVYKVTKDISNKARMMVVDSHDLYIGPEKIDRLSMRNHSYTKKDENEPTTVSLLIPVQDEVYDYFKQFTTKKDYLEAKRQVGLSVKEYVKDYFELTDDDLELIDVTTPLTYERYLNAYRGSYMSYISTKSGKGLMRSGVVKGLKNFMLTGQWLMSPGGLPIAVFTGKHAAYEICHQDKKKFINKEKKYPELSLKKKRKLYS